MIPVPIPSGPAASWIADYVKEKARGKDAPVLILDHHHLPGWLDDAALNSGQRLRLWNAGERRALEVRVNVATFQWANEPRDATGVDQALRIQTANGLDSFPIDLAPEEGRWVALTRVVQDDHGKHELVLSGVGRRWSGAGRLTLGIRVTWEDTASTAFSASHHWTATVDWNGILLDRGGTITVAVVPS